MARHADYSTVVGVCPRCGAVPAPDDPARRVDALSRTTRGEHDVPVYVCSPCGTAEGMEQFAGQLTPQSEWPVVR